MIWQALIAGALIRWCSLLPVFMVLWAPRWIGAEEFGIGAMVMAWPYLVQGLCEPILVTLCIQEITAAADYRRLAKVRDQTGIAVAICALAAFGFAVWRVPAEARTDGVICGALAAAFLLLATVNTWLIGISYALQTHRVLMWSIALSGLTQIACFWWWQQFGAGAMLAGLLTSQCVHFAVSISSPKIRTGLRHLSAARSDAGFRAEYWSALSLRVPTLLLNTGTVLLAGVTMPPAQVAAFRMSIGLAGAMNYAIPISPQTLQSTLTASAGRAQRSARIMLVGAFVVLCGVSAVLFHFAGDLIRWLLAEETVRSFDGKIFLAIPCFLLMQPVATYLYATGHRERLTWATLGCIAAFAAGAATGDPGWAFAAGAAAHLATILGGAAVSWIREQRTPLAASPETDVGATSVATGSESTVRCAA